jgi:hypothetical protein
VNKQPTDEEVEAMLELGLAISTLRQIMAEDGPSATMLRGLVSVIIDAAEVFEGWAWRLQRLEAESVQGL